MPIRAMLIFPAKNTPLPVRWGWPQIDGIVDTRSGASYDLKVLTSTGAPTIPGWTITGQTPILGPREENRGANLARLAVAAGTYPGEGYPVFATPPNGEAPYVLQLTVRSPSGFTTTDTQEIYLDNTSFTKPAGSYWPFSREAAVNEGLESAGIVATDIDGSGQYRIFVHNKGSFLCLAADGTLLWEQPIRIHTSATLYLQYPPTFLVEDLDGDGTKEIVIASYKGGGGVAYPPGVSDNENYVLVLKADGSLYNSNWPAIISTADSHYFTGYIAAGDVNGDGSKEIILNQHFAGVGGVYERLQILDLNGQQLAGWPTILNSGEYPEYWPLDAPVVADIDNDGKAEIILDDMRMIYEDNSQANPNWPPAPPNEPVVDIYKNGGLQVRQLDGDNELEIIEYGTASLSGQARVTIDVREHDGTRLPGNWPAYLDAPINREERDFYGFWASRHRSSIHVDTAQIVGGGALEIVVAHDKIQLLDTGGNVINSATLPAIDLGGEARGLQIIDVDGDGALEYVVLVVKFEDDDGWQMSAYANLEAYDLNGTPLSLTDNRWPIRVAYANRASYNHGMALGNTVLIEDIDGVSGLEVINFLGHHPHRHWYNVKYWSVTSGHKLPQVIEVLDIP